MSCNLSTSVTHKCGPQFEEVASTTKPGRNRALMTVTPSTQSWNEFFAFIEEWERLRRRAA